MLNLNKFYSQSFRFLVPSISDFLSTVHICKTIDLALAMAVTETMGY